MEATSNILMVRPVHFGYNSQTAESNAFQKKPAAEDSVHEKALKEFDNLVNLLQENGVNVTVIEDTPDPHTPDSIFPNNWVSTHHTGKVFLYPMHAVNRRFERKMEVIEAIKSKFKVGEIIDLSYFEKEDKFLEGTGSMVLDRKKKIAYACISPRTHREVLSRFAELTGYKTVPFHAFGREGKAIYHTNVLMCVAEKFSVICIDAIPDVQEKETVVKSLIGSGKEIIEISPAQVSCFAGNMLQIKNKQGDNLLVMSEQAYKALTDMQIDKLSGYCNILYSPLQTIESNGGGSARCMIAEVHLEEK
jgi:hypothetical protein